jgi:hypothetical protein
LELERKYKVRNLKSEKGEMRRKAKSGGCN